MAKTSLKVKAARKPKFAVRGYTRCQRCGRPKAVYRKRHRPSKGKTEERAAESALLAA